MRPPLVHALAAAAPFILALALRAAYLHALTETPGYRVPVVDAAYHDAWARALAFGPQESLPSGHPPVDVRLAPCFRPPGYPLFLAAIYRLAGPAPLWPRLANLAAGCLSLLLLGALGRRVFGARAAWLAMLLAGSYWGLIYFEGELLEVPLLVLSATACLYCLDRAADPAPHPWRIRAWALGSGLALGIHAVSRPNILLAAPALALWLGWRRMRGEREERSTLNAERSTMPGAVAAMAALTLGTLLAIAPVTIRNRLASGEWVLISANGGINLHIGNNDRAKGLFRGATDTLDHFGDSSRQEELLERLGRQRGAPLTAREADRYFTRLALGWMRRHPGRTLLLAGRKLVYLASARETGHNRVIACDRLKLPVLRHLPGNWGLLLALAALASVPAAAGAAAKHRTQSAGSVETANERKLTLMRASRLSCVAFWRSRILVTPEGVTGEPQEVPRGANQSTGTSGSTLVGLFVACYAASFIPFFVTGQYRMPLAPWLCLWAGAGIDRLVRALGRRDWRHAALALLAAGAVFTASAVNWLGIEPNWTKWHFDEAIAWQQLGHPDQAAEHYRAATRAGGDARRAWFNLGLLEFRRGRYDEAVAAYEGAFRAGMTGAGGQIWFHLGNARLRQGRPREALAAYTEALKRQPGNAAWRHNYEIARQACGADTTHHEEHEEHEGGATDAADFADEMSGLGGVDWGRLSRQSRRFRQSRRSGRSPTLQESLER